MFTKLSVLIPTRKRLPRLKTLLDSYAQTTAGCESKSELVFRVDDDDQATQDFLLDGWATGRCMFIGPRYEGYASLPVFFNELASVADGDVLMCGNDDMVFQSPGWALTILEEANNYPDGLFDFGVSTFNESHYPFSTVSKKFVEALGFIWDPRIFWGDIYLRDVMRAFDRCKMIPDVRIDHVWAGRDPDHTFNEGNEQRFLPRGDAYWKAVHQPAVDDAINKLREFVL